jgi:hypothetical protein
MDMRKYLQKGLAGSAAALVLCVFLALGCMPLAAAAAGSAADDGIEYGPPPTAVEILEQIVDGEVPLGGIFARGEWSVVNLMMVLLMLVSSSVILARIFLQSKFTVTYYGNGNTAGREIYTPGRFHKGDTPVLGQKDLRKEGCRFAGWALSPEKANAETPMVVFTAEEAELGIRRFNLTADTDFYAVWLKNGENTNVIVEEDPSLEEDGFEYAYSRKRSSLMGLAAILVGLSASALFLLLENWHFPMVWIDTWTALIALIFLAHVGILTVRRLLRTEYICEERDSETRRQAN